MIQIDIIAQVHSRLIAVAFSGLLLLFPMFVSTAQWIHPSRAERPDLYVTIQDSLSIYLISGEGITINPDEVHAAYVFDTP